ncbi:MAG: tRNA (adenosine(37)-N6)-threonylcarbamoyltransferase complex dimerization subunit type 1 TsaB [Acidobacteriota bacterium]
MLALDTTTRAGSVAVCDDEHVLALIPGDGVRGHAERLPGELAAALEAASITRDQIDLLAVATGPGAFTGLRIGLAAMQGLAMTLNKPVIGISALDALAAQVIDSDTTEPMARRAGDSAKPTARSAVEVIVPWMDAQRGEVFATLIDRKSGTVIETPTAANPELLLESWRAHLAGRHVIFIGDAAARDAALITRNPGERWETRTPAPLAAQIAKIGLRRARNGEAGPPHSLEPIYVRRPDPEIERERGGRS